MDVRIVAFADARYADITSNWIRSIERLALLDRTTVIALDKSLQQTMAAQGCTVRVSAAALVVFRRYVAPPDRCAERATMF